MPTAKGRGRGSPLAGRRVRIECHHPPAREPPIPELGGLVMGVLKGGSVVAVVEGSAVGVLLALGLAYFVGLLVATAMALWHYLLIKDRTREGCFKAFRLNHWLGFAVFLGLLVDSALK